MNLRTSLEHSGTAAQSASVASASLSAPAFLTRLTVAHRKTKNDLALLRRAAAASKQASKHARKQQKLNHANQFYLREVSRKLLHTVQRASVTQVARACLCLLVLSFCLSTALLRTALVHLCVVERKLGHWAPHDKTVARICVCKLVHAVLLGANFAYQHQAANALRKLPHAMRVLLSYRILSQGSCVVYLRRERSHGSPNHIIS